jgi:hypothetical protein
MQTSYTLKHTQMTMAGFLECDSTQVPGRVGEGISGALGDGVLESGKCGSGNSCGLGGLGISGKGV